MSVSYITSDAHGNFNMCLLTCLGMTLLVSHGMILWEVSCSNHNSAVTQHIGIDGSVDCLSISWELLFF